MSPGGGPAPRLTRPAGDDFIGRWRKPSALNVCEYRRCRVYRGVLDKRLPSPPKTTPLRSRRCRRLLWNKKCTKLLERFGTHGWGRFFWACLAKPCFSDFRPVRKYPDFACDLVFSIFVFKPRFLTLARFGAISGAGFSTIFVGSCFSEIWPSRKYPDFACVLVFFLFFQKPRFSTLARFGGATFRRFLPSAVLPKFRLSFVLWCRSDYFRLRCSSVGSLFALAV